MYGHVIYQLSGLSGSLLFGTVRVVCPAFVPPPFGRYVRIRTAGCSLGRKGQHTHGGRPERDFAAYHHVVDTVDEVVFGPLIADDAELAVDVILELVAVTVQVVGGDVRDNGYVGPKIDDTVELEAAQLQYVPLPVCGGDRIGETLSDVASDGYVVSCRTEDFARHGGRGGLAVGTGDADGLSFRIASGELDFGDDRYVPFAQLHHNGGRFRNAGTFDSQVGVEYPGFGVRAFLVGDAVTVEYFGVFGRYRAFVGEKDLQPFDLSQYGRAVSALSSAQYNYFHGA